MATKKKAAKVTEPKMVVTLVNGQTTGSVPDTGTIQAAAEALAQSKGLKAFSLKVDGNVVKRQDAGKLLKGCKSIEVFAKDTRGSR